jgi:hypothetical protein
LSLTITNSTLSNPANKSQIEQNFTDVVSKFNANITTSDLSASAGITNAQLANSIYEVVCPMTVNSATWTAAADNDIVAVCGLPEDANGTSYTVIAADYLYNSPVTAASTGAEFSVVWGYYNGGTWTTTSTIVSTFNFTSLGAATSVTANLTLNTSAVTTSTTNRHFFAIRATDVVEAAGTRPMANAREYLTVTLKLKRTNGLRS